MVKIFDRRKEKDRKPEEVYDFGDKLTKRTNRDGGGLDLVGTFSEDKKKRYIEAMDKKAILFDKEDEEGVDYTHMDFVLSTGCGFYKGMTNLKAIQLFWKAFYPYLKKLTDSYEMFYDKFREIIDDQEEVLKTHAELDYKYKWALEYLKENGHGKKFDVYLHNKIHGVKKDKSPETAVKKADLPDLKK